MSVTLDITDSLYSYNGTLLQLGAVTVLPAFTDVAGTVITIEDNDGTLSPNESSTITIDGSAETVTYMGVASFNESGLVGGLLGTLLGSTEAAIFETSSGDLYIYAPDGFPVLGGVASSIEIDTDADFDLSPSTQGVVDGTSGDDTMDVGYTDGDGDVITNEVTGTLLGLYDQSGDDEIYGYAGDDQINGGSGDDIIDGGTGGDIILGGDGEDTIYGGEGADIIVGGDGEDNIEGGDGNDIIYGGDLQIDGSHVDNHGDRIVGGAGDDTIFAGDGTNIVYGEDGDDTISAGANNDYIVGGEGNDTISSGGGNDTIYGGAGNDIITGGQGDDYVEGGDGDDTWLADGETYTAGEAGSDEVYLQGGDDYAEIGTFRSGYPDILDGGDGVDTVAFDYSVVDHLDTGITLHDDGSSTTTNFSTVVNNFENVRGSSGNNVITGNNVDNILWGLDGSDTLDGAGGNDALYGGEGSDILTGGEGDDELYGGAASDVLDGGADDDILDGGAGSDNMSGGAGNDTFIIGSAAEAHGDIISGGSGPDDTTDIDIIDLSALDPDSYTITATDDPADSGALTGTVNFDSGEVLSFNGIEIICFTKGTEIITSEGPVAVENLKTGDLVMTMDHGMQPLRWMGRKKLNSGDLEASPKLKPIRIEAGALGNGTPLNDLMVSRQHRILVRSAIADRMFGVQEILVAAIKLVGHPGIEVVEDAENVEYFHMLFDQHEIVFSNGAATESLFTGPEALKAVSEDARAEILELFPDIATQTALLPARHIPQKGGMVKRFVERHSKNNKALMS